MITLKHEVRVKVTGENRSVIATEFVKAFCGAYGGASVVDGTGAWVDDNGTVHYDAFVEVSANHDVENVTDATFQYDFRHQLAAIFDSGEIAVWYSLDGVASIIEQEDIQWAHLSALCR